MEKDPTPGPFGHQGHESSNKKLPKLLQNLWALDLAQTKIHIVDGFLANFESYNLSEEAFNCPFPALTTLDMTGTPLNTTVEKLLSPFVGCKDLRMFKAAECSLTGRMPNAVPARGTTLWLLMWAGHWPWSCWIYLPTMSPKCHVYLRLGRLWVSETIHKSVSERMSWRRPRNILCRWTFGTPRSHILATLASAKVCALFFSK